jgi:hypothetical protein
MFTRRGQSILEYAILLAVVIAVLLIMQAFVKRGYQGSLKASSDKMGEQFSASGTTIKEEQSMNGDQNVVTEVGTTTDVMGQFSGGLTDVNLQGTLSKGAYSLNTREGGTVESVTDSRTESAKDEKARVTDYNDNTNVYDNYDDTVFGSTG